MKTTHGDFALTAVPQSERQGFWKMLMVMMGLTFFSASMWSGGTLGAGLTFVQFMAVVLAGNLILGAYTGGLAYVSAKTGLSTHLLSRYAFGEKGSYLASLLLGGTQVGWFGVGVVMFALPVQKVTGIDMIWLIAGSGILMTATAFFGMKALMLLSFIAVPMITILGSFSVFKATESMGGFEQLLQHNPSESLGLAAALTICIGSFISAGTLTPDFTRFSKTKKSAVTSTVIAFFIGNSLMFLFGAIGAMATGNADISEVMFTQGLIIPAILVLGLNIWTTNDNALYASGLGFSSITKITKNKVVIFNGVIGTLTAMWLYNNFVGWLTMLGSAIPPIGAIILIDYYLYRRERTAAFEQQSFKKVRWTGIIAWAAGVAAAQWVPGIAPVNAVIASVLIYTVTSKFAEQPAHNKIEEGEVA
ncbi:cytosine permease [Halobacillus alkaliphilus]|uniref:Cytosine permease n=1 Tax=Halobacillus alkaliphilus TaxID=396056 RepID=A0A1I2JRU7_9BACI|nr:cytosine permease [Halobacillus alkaliphilus]SFF57304.1 cytosine permease [Halobacillus alkaliphilus]